MAKTLLTLAGALTSSLCVMTLLLHWDMSMAAKSAAAASDDELKTRQYMIEISRHLGVTCNYCHDVKNFRDTSMKTWKTSKEHMKIVDLLNNKGFTGANAIKADCFMCHRGKAVPDYREKLGSSKEPSQKPHGH